MGDYKPNNPSEARYGNGLNQSDVTSVLSIIPETVPETELEIMAARKHKTLMVREQQISINLLGLYAGRPYIEARLSRFAGEDDVDWEGGQRGKSRKRVTGRKDQAHSVMHLSRIAEKIDQYTLGTEPERDGIDPAVKADITNTGQNINQFMQEVNDYVTAARWCWIKVDSPKLPEGDLSEADKEAQKLRPYWTVYSPLQVVDWYIDSFGTLQWILTEEVDYIADDPKKNAEFKKFRRLWEPGKVTEYEYKKEEGSLRCSNELKAGVEKPLSLKSVVPFFPVGDITEKPYGFDTLESINRTIMDLESCSRQNYFNCMYPQLVIPAGMIAKIMNTYSVSAETAASMVMGYNYPIEAEKDDVEPKYIMPNASSSESVRKEVDALKHNLWDSVGLMLQQETKQVASANAKAWDFLDVNQVMKERAMLLEDAELKAVELSKMWDSSFNEWKPEYNKSFDITDPKADMEAIILGSQIELTPSLHRIMLSKVLDVFKRIGSGKVTAEEAAAAAKEIEVFEKAKFEVIPPAIEGEE